MRFFNGELQLSSDDLSSGGFGLSWGHARAYSNQPTVTHNYGNGNNWLVNSWGYLVADGSRVEAVLSPSESYWFQRSGDAFLPLHAINHQLQAGPGNTLRLVLSSGAIWEFYDFDEPVLGAELKRIIPKHGDPIDLVYQQGSDRLSQARRSHTDGAGQTTTESFLYAYLTTGENAGLLESVTLTRQKGQGSAQAVRRVVYSYYGSNDPHGNRGDLRQAVRQVLDAAGQWADGGTEYYRYHTTGTTLLKYVLRGESYRRLAAIENPLESSDQTVARYADYYFQYDGQQRVVREEVKGGTIWSEFAYARADELYSWPPQPENFNVWDRKTVETKSDGSTWTVYSNPSGRTLLKDVQVGNHHWIEYFGYDDAGRQILAANPSAVAGYQESDPQLGGPQEILRADQGLVRLTEYGQSTTAGETQPGDVEGYASCEKIRRGRNGTPVVLRRIAYYAHSAGGATLYPVAAEVAFADEAGTQPIITGYSYAWHPSSLQISERTVTLPAVPSEQNGSGQSDTEIDRFDLYANLTWHKCPRGYLTCHAYDPVTGGRLQTIRDVDTTRVSDAPTGWATPATGGLHLTTDYELDDQGRTTQILGPSHTAVVDGQAATVRTATWWTYDDINREFRTSQGYATGTAPEYTYTLVSPVSIERRDAADRVTDSIQAVRPSTAGRLSASDELPQSTWCRWTKNLFGDVDDDGLFELMAQRVYYAIPTSGEGAAGTNYNETRYGYTASAKQNMVRSPGGTITRTVFDARGRQAQIWIGTNDFCATDADPTGGSSQGNNMVLVTEYQYDAAQPGGDGNLTQTLQHVDATSSLATSFAYDWRNRRVTTAGEESSFAKIAYDNLDRPVQAERYQGSESGNLIARSDRLYDARGRVYRTVAYAVDPSTGQVGNSLVNNTWYDASGNPIKQQPAGSQLFTKTVVDGARRSVRVYQAYDADETNWADAASVADDTVVEQVENVFDPAGNLMVAARSMRMHTASDDQVGPLNSSCGPDPKARVVYVANWYDGVGRPIAAADYGTNDGAPPVRPETVPERSDTVLVTSIEYNDRGEAFKTVDPAGRESRQFFDDAGRTVKTVRNYVDGVVDGDHPDEDVTVETRFTADGQIAALTARNPATGDQVTRYAYGTTLADSAIARGDLLRAEIYPDSDDTAEPLGNGPDGVYDRVEYCYNRQGQRVRKTDQNGTVHVYGFDRLGRLCLDSVSVFGAGVDSGVAKIAHSYEVRGLPALTTSYDAQDNVVNQVSLTYDSLGLLVHDYQSHSGAVNEATTPTVWYGHNQLSGRREWMMYPNRRFQYYRYNSGIDDQLSRISCVSDIGAGMEETRLVEYQRLGLNTFVQTDYPEAQLRCDLAHGTGDDPYAGFDRFGRIVDLRWWSNTSIAEDVERVRHGYDRAGNRLWRECPVAASFGKHFDERYTYDRVDQLVSLRRGELNAEKTGLVTGTKNWAEDWSLDMTGNWAQYRQDTNGDGTWELNQSRTQNAANEILTIGGTAAHVAHDGAGSMRRIPKADDWNGHFNLTYDAWNRVVRVTDGSTNQTVAEYEYDGRNYRILKKTYLAGELSETRHSYYSDQWQVLEERLGDSETADRQFVWGLRYIDDLVLRDRDSMGYATLDERLYALQDPNWNVTAIVGPDGSAVERYSYQAYGHVDVLTPSFAFRGVSAFAWETLFTGRRLDTETGLYDYRMRLYGSDLGTFPSSDPIGYMGGMRVYGYVANNPATGTDPSGLLRKPRQGYFPVPNGCGAAGGKQFPGGDDLFGMWTFTPACNDHDICYGTCNASKTDCDRKFFADMRAGCRSFWDSMGWNKANPLAWILYESCLNQADMYMAGVALSQAGADAFKKSQDEACEPEKCDP